MNVKWYYRQSEVPDSVYQHLVQDRNNENGERHFHLAAPPPPRINMLAGSLALVLSGPHTSAGALLTLGLQKNYL